MKIALIGASGYGAYYIDLIKRFVDLERHTFHAVIDPFADKSPNLEWIKSHNIPVYGSLYDFYKESAAELVIISSPIQFHKEQCIMAMLNGSAVLCEKPLAPIPEDALEILKTQKDTGQLCGVGFQWSFSPAMLELKKDILAGLFGKPKRLKSLVAWKRGDDYYSPNGWKGRVKDKNGNFVMDSVAMNATAHYLHNMLFLLGGEIDSAALPINIEGCVYRARDIESYDTIFLKGELPHGAEMLFTASHVTEISVNPIFSYEFEKGTITFGDDTRWEVRAVFTDGSIKSYGFPQSEESNAQKLLSMLQAVENKEKPACHIETIMPHLQVCHTIYERMPVKNFPAESIVMENNPAGRFVKGLNEAMNDFYF